MSNFEHIAFAARTDVGRKRKNNEDAFGTFPEAGIFCVADGMGGGDDGEIASAAVIKGVEEAARLCTPSGEGGYASADVAEALEASLSRASEWMFNRAAEKHLTGCGSTFVGIVLDATRPDSALAVHAGDSRLYLLRGKSIRQITRDHSAAEMIGVKDESKISPMFRSMVMNAVGIKPSVNVEATPMKIERGDRVLVCSDGLSRMVPDKKISSISREHSDLGEAADALIAAALEAGGVDNVTVVLLEVGQIPAPAATLQAPDPEAEFVNDDKDTFDATGQTDPQTGIPGSPGDAESQTMQTVMPAADMPRAKSAAGASTTSDAADGRKSARILIAAVAAAAALAVAALVAWLASGRKGETESPSPPPPPPAAAPVAVPAPAVDTPPEPVPESDEPASLPPEPETPAAPADSGLAAPAADAPGVSAPEADSTPTQNGLESALDAVPEAADNAAEAPSADAAAPEPQEPAVHEILADACDAANVSRFVATLKRLVPEDKATLEFMEQVRCFEKSAKSCARTRSEKSALNAAVDLRIMLSEAGGARDALAGAAESDAMREWLADWDAVVAGKEDDPEVIKACARLVAGSEEARAP